MNICILYSLFAESQIESSTIEKRSILSIT